jgi:hypothetical protein
VVTGTLAIDLNAELKLYSQRAILCECECSLPVYTRPYGRLSDATHNCGLTLTTRFVLNIWGE